MNGAGVLEMLASGVGFLFLSLGVAAIGQRLRDLIDQAFGAQMRAQFGEETAVPRPDDVHALRDKGAL